MKKAIINKIKREISVILKISFVWLGISLLLQSIFVPKDQFWKINNITVSLIVAFVAGILQELVELMSEVKEKMQDNTNIKASLEQLISEEAFVERLKGKTSETFQHYFSNYFLKLSENIKSIIKDEIVVIDGIYFKIFYTNLLKGSENISFKATSSVKNDYFWPDWDGKIPFDTVEYQTQLFTKEKRGKFDRIFFIDKDDKKDLNRIKKIFKIQESIGVKVNVYDVEKYPLDREDIRFILISTNKLIGWEVICEQGSWQIKNTKIFMNKNDLIELSYHMDRYKKKSVPAQKFLNRFESETC